MFFGLPAPTADHVGWSLFSVPVIIGPGIFNLLPNFAEVTRPRFFRMSKIDRKPFCLTIWALNWLNLEMPPKGHTGLRVGEHIKFNGFFTIKGRLEIRQRNRVRIWTGKPIDRMANKIWPLISGHLAKLIGRISNLMRFSPATNNE